jgi:hypothetical protein
MSGFFDLFSPTLSYQNEDQRVIHAPYETYSPVTVSKKNIQMDYSYAPTFNFSSAGGSGATISSKKDSNQAGDVNPSIQGATDTLSQAQSAGSGGLDIWVVAVIGVCAVAGLYAISRKK